MDVARVGVLGAGLLGFQRVPVIEQWVPLFLFAVSGMLLFPAANDLLMLFVALEVMSLPLYLLAGMALDGEWVRQMADLVLGL